MRTSCILIADMHMASRQMLRFALELKGWKAVDADSAPPALELLAEGGFGLILISLYPGESVGRTVLEGLCDPGRSSALPVILIGDPMLRVEFAALLWRATAWIDRPFRVSELTALVESVLKRGAGTAG